MHERAAVSGALAEMMAESGGSVTEVIAAVGPDVDLGVVTGIWEEMVFGTVAATARLVCEPAVDTLRCIDCGDDYRGSKLDRCPGCGGDGLVIVAAPEFEILSWVGAG
jgi:Zn finger protein HypA/HybF involved in hydrogenase expression